MNMLGVPKYTVNTRRPDGAGTVQALPRRTPEAGHAAGHWRHRSQPFQGQKPPLSMLVAVRDNSSGQVRPSPAGDSATGEEQARPGTTLQEARNFQGSFWKPRVFVWFWNLSQGSLCSCTLGFKLNLRNFIKNRSKIRKNENPVLLGSWWRNLPFLESIYRGFLCSFWIKNSNSVWCVFGVA
jgi:hypothetical protein